MITVTTILPSLLRIAASEVPAARVRITSALERVAVIHQGQRMFIERVQEPAHTIHPDYARTSHPCPPFCIQTTRAAPGVETVAEREVLDALRQISLGKPQWLVIDSRTPDWVAKGTIPDTINIPWTELKPEAGADPFDIRDILQEQFGVDEQEGLLDFSPAKTLVLFCNGPWCGQSPSNIRTLLHFGYPAHKIQWYRGGMQAWESLGLTVTRPVSPGVHK